MPCLCEGPSEADREISKQDKYIRKLESEKNNLEAALCTALTYIESRHVSLSDFLCITDWDEAGIAPNQVVTWWVKHKEKDELRRRRELAQKQRLEKEQKEKEIKETRIKTALSKLTPEEKVALGFK